MAFSTNSSLQSQPFADDVQPSDATQRERVRDSDPSRSATLHPLPGDNSAVAPPDPIPNSEVKRSRADGSVHPHARVGHRQGLFPKPRINRSGVFLCAAANQRHIATAIRGTCIWRICSSRVAPHRIRHAVQPAAICQDVTTRWRRSASASRNRCARSLAAERLSSRQCDLQDGRRLAADDHHVRRPTREQADADHARDLVELALQADRIDDRQAVDVEDHSCRCR